MMVSAEDVIEINKLLSTNGIQVWLTGGWGIDALLEKQTRPHKDLDLIMLLDDIPRMCELLGSCGYEMKEIWPENRWVIDSHKNKTATAFILIDSNEREIDVHALTLDDQGNGIPAWDEAEEFIFTNQDLSGVGMLCGVSLRCITPESQLICHRGYKLPKEQLRDMKLLHEKFNMEQPES